MSLAYVIRGSGPPVIFIQGAGIHGSGWDPQVNSLASRFECLTFDNRGIGGSVASSPKNTKIPLTVAQMADDVVNLMDSAGWQSAHMVGHSMGGLVALEASLQWPARVRSLSLLCTFSRGADATRVSPSMVWTGIRMHVGTRAARRRAFLEFMMPPGVIADPVEIGAIAGHDLADQPAIVMDQLAAIRKHDVTARLRELASIPTLVVSAARDRIARAASGRVIAAGIPGARYVEFADAGHGLTIQKADEVNGLLAEHFNSVR